MQQKTAPGQAGLVGSRIRERRMEAGIKQAELAKSIGISPAYLNLIEHNRRRIAGRVLNDIARALGVEAASLAEGAGDLLLTQLANVAAGPDGDGAEAARIEEFAGRYPGWARTIARQARRIEALERTVSTLSDRLTHDPFLSESLHDLLSTVTAIRSTASILVETPDIEPEWRERFQRNVFEDSARLAEGAEGLVGYLDAGATEEASLNSPQEEFETWLSAREYRIDALDAGEASPEDILSGQDAPASHGAHAIAERYLARYRADALAMPAEAFAAAMDTAGRDPAALAARFGTSPAAVLRRMATLLGDGAGLVICDGSGTLVHRKPLHGFPLPRFGAACPLWPLYRALGQPMTPIRAAVSLSGRMRQSFLTYAICEPTGPVRFDAPPVVEATMLILPAPSDTKGEPVGTSCRICARAACPARREPAMIAQQDPGSQPLARF